MAALPIPLDVLRTRLRIEVESDDVDLAVLCVAAGEMIERETGLGLQSISRTQSIRTFSRFIPRVQPMTAVTQVRYYDSSGTRQTLPATDYWIDDTEPLLALEFDTSVVPSDTSTIEVTYTAGYTTIPQALQQCIVALVGSWYNNPEALQVAQLAEVPLAYKAIIAQYSVQVPFR
jgi:uncharacterized phiE125 gp8 family phage protein